MGGPMRMNPPRGMAMGPQVGQLPDAIVTDAYLAAEWANGPLQRCVSAPLGPAVHFLGGMSNGHIPDNYSCSNHLLYRCV